MNLRRDDVSVLSKAQPSLPLILSTLHSQSLAGFYSDVFIQHCYTERTKNGQLKKKKKTLITFSTKPTGRHTGTFLLRLLVRFNDFTAVRLSAEPSQEWMLSLQHGNPAVTHDHHLSQPNSSLFPTPTTVRVKFLPMQG